VAEPLRKAPIGGVLPRVACRPNICALGSEPGLKKNNDNSPPARSDPEATDASIEGVERTSQASADAGTATGSEPKTQK